MTERDIFSENNLVSATECTGAAPRAMDEDAAETIADITNARCSPSFTAEDPSHSPLQRESVGPSDTHSQRTTTPVSRPASKCSRCRRG